MKKWTLPALYVLMLGIGFINRHDLIRWLESEPPLSLIIILATLLALFPIAPFRVVIAILGFAYGTLWAAAIAWLSTTAAAVIIYVVVRTIYREPGGRLLERYSALQGFTTMVERHPFPAMVLARLMPVVPQMAVNIYAGVASIPFWTYTIASALGKSPGILLYAWLGSGFSERPLLFVLLSVAIVALTGIGLALIRRIRRRRE
ncbi:hypothetical protein JCM10914A_37950 [Paenibacillus sp. JCM 10914]